MLQQVARGARRDGQRWRAACARHKSSAALAAPSLSDAAAAAVAATSANAANAAAAAAAAAATSSAKSASQTPQTESSQRPQDAAPAVRPQRYQQQHLQQQRRKILQRETRMSRRDTALPGLSPSEIIVKKRSGLELTAQEIEWFISGFHRGDVEDYQMSSLLMSIAIKSMSNREAADLTLSMVRTGSTACLSEVRPDHPKVDKHSTGGVGDSTSLILAPLLSCFDVVVPLLSGRSLGHTGGTLDKVDSIPGCRTTLSKEAFLEVLQRTGAAFASPDSTGFAPVDSGMYALRDVSGSVESIALVASSVMSKKLATNPHALLLDVKRGRGAFFDNLNDTASLASMMCSIGEKAGIETLALITNMDHVLGGSVGNWLEVQEAAQILAGGCRDVNPDPRFRTSPAALAEMRDLALSEAAVMLGMAGRAGSFAEGFAMAREKLATGAALDRLAEIVSAQGGDASVLFDLARAAPPVLTETLLADDDCVLQDADARKMGCAATLLGAGRRYAGDAIDWHAGVVIHGKIGEVFHKGAPVLTAVVRDPGPADASSILGGVGLADSQTRLERGFDLACRGLRLAPARPHNMVSPPPIIEYMVNSSGVRPFKSLGNTLAH